MAAVPTNTSLFPHGHVASLVFLKTIQFKLMGFPSKSHHKNEKHISSTSCTTTALGHRGNDNATAVVPIKQTNGSEDSKNVSLLRAQKHSRARERKSDTQQNPQFNKLSQTHRVYSLNRQIQGLRRRFPSENRKTYGSLKKRRVSLSKVFHLLSHCQNS